MDRSIADIRRALADATAEDLPALLRYYAADPRNGVADACAVASRRLERDRREDERLDELCRLEADLAAEGIGSVAGVDEVGRGALAGPVTAAAVILPAGFRPRGITDSKRLAPDARLRFDALIRHEAIAWSVAHVPPSEIDARGIAAATAEAMRQAIAGLGCIVDHVLVDGLPVDLGCPTTAIVKGDARVRSIAAASIVAKVARDALMAELAVRVIGYGLAENKGYGSPDHLAALVARGPSDVHRRSFAPCSQTRMF
jgi:ribonuclease HII